MPGNYRMKYVFDKFEIDTNNYQLSENGRVVAIEPLAFNLLVYLLENRSRVVSKDELFENLWAGKVVSDAALASRLKDARKAVNDTGTKQSVIKTIHGRGYQFVAVTTETGRSALANEANVTSELGRSNPQTTAVENLQLPDKPSIAVLPFENLSGDAEQEFFSDGITEDIITQLSHFESLFVVARKSSFKFRDQSVDIREIGSSLGVRFILEGSVRGSENRIRLTAQLIDATTGEHVWADRFDRDLEGVFAVQDEISSSIVSTIAGRIDAYDSERIGSKPTSSLSAYESVLRGQKLLHGYTEASFIEAQEHFQQAMSLDPRFARAFALNAYSEIAIWLFRPSPDHIQRALQSGTTALELDDQESKAHLALGTARLFNFEWDKSDYHLQRAKQLNPNDDLIMIEYARLLVYTGRPLEGEELVLQAMRQNPFYPNWFWNVLTRCLHTACKYEEAMASINHLTHRPFWAQSYMAACCAQLGRLEEAAAYREATLEAKPDFSVSNFARVLPYRDEKDLNKFLEGFTKAGFPT